MYSAYSLLLTLGLLTWSPSILLRALRSPRYLEGWRERLGYYPAVLLSQLHAVQPVWLHAVSVGEVGAACILLIAGCSPTDATPSRVDGHRNRTRGCQTFISAGNPGRILSDRPPVGRASDVGRRETTPHPPDGDGNLAEFPPQVCRFKDSGCHHQWSDI